MANMYYCSDGSVVTDATIKNRYKRSKEKKWAGFTVAPLCGGCEEQQGNDNDHTIAKARCKKIRKTELIWNPDCYVWSCRKCHHEWEDFKSGDWLLHKNVDQRLEFMKKHDPEGFLLRVEFTRAALRGKGE